MTVQQQVAAFIRNINLPHKKAAHVFLAILILAFLASSQAQTLSVLHSFTDGGDGGESTAGLTTDRAGNFYGTTSIGGAAGRGTVFKLSHMGSGWILNTLYVFQGGDDGANPFAGVVFGPDGALYGTTSDETVSGRVGTVFRLTPPSHPCRSISCPWTKTILYRFQGGADGASPNYGNLVFDAAGNMYGTTVYGGGGPNCQFNNCGVVYKLTRSGGGWAESVLYRFTDSLDPQNGGELPESGVILDSAGNLYGTAFIGGRDNDGVVFQLSQSGDSWTETVLHSFGEFGDGILPFGGLIMDRQGNLYGATGEGPSGSNGGTVYELQRSGDSWTYSTQFAFPGNGVGGPQAPLTMDAAGNLYGMTTGDGSHGFGNVFKLTSSSGGWIYTDLYDFTQREGSYSFGSVVLDAHGNIYGTTFDTWGEAWEITP